MLSARAFAIAAASPCALAGAGAPAPLLAVVRPLHAASAQPARSMDVVRLNDLMLLTVVGAGDRPLDTDSLRMVRPPRCGRIPAFPCGDPQIAAGVRSA